MHYNILNSEVFLDHLSIESTNPERIAQFYSKNMMMDTISISKNEWHCIGSVSYTHLTLPTTPYV